ncbi:hypothetical protein E2C01_026737 [Portunus trituberculatus]|uniref:Uncharacterized protein n=1 Tax=Portunus trituberculatus TaxID=210409 RepID=A0A5B7EJ57_PORTR|nr:hypothetical protein [Portunus trituberculatus]
MFNTSFGFHLPSLTTFGELAYNIAIRHDFEQLVQHPTRSPKAEVPLAFYLCQMGGDLRRYYADFPWNDYCFHVRDPSLYAERITEERGAREEAEQRLSVRRQADKSIVLNVPRRRGLK